MAAVALLCPHRGRVGSTPKSPPAGAKVRCPDCTMIFAYAAQPIEASPTPSVPAPRAVRRPSPRPVEPILDEIEPFPTRWGGDHVQVVNVHRR